MSKKVKEQKPKRSIRIDPAGNTKPEGTLNINDYMYILFGYTDHLESPSSGDSTQKR